MPSLKTITISLPVAMGKEIEKVAKEEHRTTSELIREAFRQYQSQRPLSDRNGGGRVTPTERRVSAFHPEMKMRPAPWARALRN